MADREKLRAELRQILDKPIFPREGIDPIEAVTDYLLDNDVLPVVRCRDCKYCIVNKNHPNKPLICCMTRKCGTTGPDWFCADGERREVEKR